MERNYVNKKKDIKTYFHLLHLHDFLFRMYFFVVEVTFVLLGILEVVEHSLHEHLFYIFYNEVLGGCVLYKMNFLIILKIFFNVKVVLPLKTCPQTSQGVIFL